MPAPNSVKVEIEFTDGVWTDVSAYLELGPGATIRYGRTSPYSAPQSASCTLTLDNTDGRFTPLRQTLADGTTAHPYYPNVVPRKRLRVSYVVGGVTYTRFTGYVKAWPTGLANAYYPRVTIAATDRLDRLARVRLAAPIRQAVMQSAPALYWPLTDEVGSTFAAEQSGTISAPSLSVSGDASAPLAFGADGPGTGDGTAVAFAPSSDSAGQTLYMSTLDTLLDTATSDYSIAFAYNAGDSLPSWASGIGTEIILDLTGPDFLELNLYLFGGALSAESSVGAVNGATSRADGGWHSAVLVVNTGSSTAELYDDGLSVGTFSTGFTPTASAKFLRLGDVGTGSAYASNHYQGRLAHVALHQGALTPGQAAAFHGAVRGWAGELVHERIARFLGYAGLTSSEWNLDTSTVALGSYGQGGKDIVTACQDTVTSEGGGAALYVGTDGKARFIGRTHRGLATTPALTVDNEADLDANTFAPSYDDSAIVNEVQASRATASGTATTQTVSDADSQAAFGITSDLLTSYASADADVLYNAQDRLAQQRAPGFRLPQVTVDLYTAMTAGLWADVAGVEIGDRVRVTGLPVTTAPATTLDFFVEGWQDSIGVGSYTVTFDLSPADNPPRAVFDDGDFGRFQAQGITLNGAITAAATSISVASSAETFTTTSARYPLTIQIGEEQMTITAAPASSASPQTLTVTRGANGTTPAAQSNGASVSVVKPSTFAL